MNKPKIAVIGTGGTITALGKTPLDYFEYIATGKFLAANELVEKFSTVRTFADIVPITIKAVSSTEIGFPEWKRIVMEMDRVVAVHPDLAGIVVLHGTATLEETAYALNLTAKVAVPIVVVGAQRPASALSSDAGLNFLNAVRAAATPEARGLGVLVCLNDEVQAAREVTKTSTARLHTFRSPDFGILGHADSDAVSFYRRPIRKSAPETEFDIRNLSALPRVDIAYAYSGGDGTAIRSFVAARARGIVMAGFPPGTVSPGEMVALQEARAAGVVVVISSRAAGRVLSPSSMLEAGFLPADNLTPQKARVLLSLALTQTESPEEIRRMFATY